MKTHQDDLPEMPGPEGQDHDPPEDPRWEALAMGLLSDEEAAALRAEAEGSEEGRRKYELYRPYDAVETEASVAEILRKVDARALVGEAPPAIDAFPGAPAGPSPVQVPAPLVPAGTPPTRLARRWRSRGPVLVAALAMAAAFALWLARPAPREPLAFAVSTNGGEQVQRSDTVTDSRSLRLTGPKTHGKVKLKLELPAALKEQPRVRTLLLLDGKLSKADPCNGFSWDKKSNQGEIDCAREDMVTGSPAGKWSLLVAVGVDGAIPDDDAELVAELGRAHSGPSTRGFQVFELPVDFIGPHGTNRLEVEHSGCGLRRTPGGETVCELPRSRSLNLWIKTAQGAKVTRTLDGKPLQSPGKAVQGGELFAALGIPDDARLLVVEADDHGLSPPFRLTLAPRSTSPELEKADSLRGDTSTRPQARELVLGLVTHEDPVIRALAMRKLARIERDMGEFGAAIGHFQEALTLDRAAGLISAEVDDRLALSYALSQNSAEHRRHFSEARRVLAEMQPVLAASSEARALLPYYLAIIDVTTGDTRAALRRSEEAERGTERLGLTSEWSEARRQHANVLSILGRKTEALAVFRELERARVFGQDPCAEQQFLNDFGWLALSLSDADAPTRLEAPDPKALFESSLSLFRERCPGPDIAHVLTNLALSAVARGDATEARARLDEARKGASRPEPRVEASWREVEARIAVHGGRHQEALKAYEQLAAFAEEASLPVFRAEAALGRAGALDALGKVDDARKAYAEADALLDARSLQVPIGEGKEGFLARHAQSTRRRVDFLLRQSEKAGSKASSLDYLAEATTAARRSRARILASLQSTERLDSLSPEERRAWEEAMDAYHLERAAFDADGSAVKDHRAIEAKLDAALALTGAQGGEAMTPLPGPAKGEVILVYFPVLDGWAGFAIREQGITAHRLGAVDVRASKEALSTQLLSPFQAAIEGASRLRLAPYGLLAGLDIHALPWKGRPLLAALPVVHGVDLPQSRREPSASASPLRALVVDDPEENLPRARDEGSDVARLLGEKGARVVQLSGGLATREAMLSELAGVGFFHYSGHARFDAQRDGLESGLALAGHRRLTAGDILALPGVPRYVVLSGCETGRTAEGERPQGLGLGQAFIARGAVAVVAATRVVDDTLARRLMTELIRRSGDHPGDLGAALREAQLAVSLAQPDSDWATFRALVP